MTQHKIEKNGQQRRHWKEAEALTMAIERLIDAKLAHVRVPSVGAEAVEERHKLLAEEIERAL